jgi:hypothetical protein
MEIICLDSNRAGNGWVGRVREVENVETCATPRPWEAVAEAVTAKYAKKTIELLELCYGWITEGLGV